LFIHDLYKLREEKMAQGKDKKKNSKNKQKQELDRVKTESF